MSFNHALNVMSDFSIGKSLLQIDHIIETAINLGYESVAICDEMSIHNIVDFSNKAKKAGLKPIIGCKLRVYDNPTYRAPSKKSGVKGATNHMTAIKVYLTGDKGITSLMKLLTKANSKENFYYNSRCGWRDVLALEDVAISTGDFYSLWHHPRAKMILDALQKKFSNSNVFVELVPINTPLFDTLNVKALTAIQETGCLPLVTYPTLYVSDEDADSLDVLNAITTQTKMSVNHRPIQFVRDFGFKGPKQLLVRAKDAHGRIVKFYPGVAPISWGPTWIAGIRNVPTLAEMSKYEFKKMPVSLPVLAENEFQTLGRLCIEGWKSRFSAPVLGHQPDPTDYPTYQARLKYELSVLKSMGFAGYFLLVEDLVTWAKSNGIIVGPGRGSVGGSLVAYLIGITDVDPIRFDLIFERFINPDRLDLPDADLDFMSTRRHEVIAYLVKKYGADHVAGISNFSTLASASALRDTGRIHDLSPIDLMATKLVPKEQGQSFTLTESAIKVPELDKFKSLHPKIWGHALKLEGVMRAFATHAAGVVVGGEPLVNRAVLETRDSDGPPVVVWDKRTVEDFGLVKMDILGLSTLDVLEIARSYIKDRHGKEIDYLRLPLEEKDVMDAFGRGDTTGVFQFESPGMKKLLRELAMGGDLTFEDITATTALYRPGPMDSGLMADFVQIKQGHKIPYYEHPNMIPALESTQSVIIYQEQVMKLAVDLAGFTNTAADHLRKIMGKKQKDEMAEMRSVWIDGCKTKSGMDASTAGELFDKIEAFAGYGFNKSHAVAYSIVSYWTMWVRVRYPAEYFAACLSIVVDDKISGLVAEARQYGIEVLPPDINLSTDRFTIPDDKHLLAPFSKVMGISDNTARRIVELRSQARGFTLSPKGKVIWDAEIKGRWDSPDEFINACAELKSKVNVKVVRNLIAVGATAAIDLTVLTARHPDRRKEQTELMPGLILDVVKADRTTDVTDKYVRAKVIHIVKDYRTCGDCDLAGESHPQIRMKDKVKFMVVTDCPSWQEEKQDKLMEGDAATYIKSAIKAAGLSPANGYFTTLVKARKNEKFLSNAQVNNCTKFLAREIDLIKPAVIVALGSATVRHFLPGSKKSPAEMAGTAVFDSKLDASIVCGINAQQISFDESKLETLYEVFRKVAEIVD